jgi:hypothetical protein
VVTIIAQGQPAAPLAFRVLEPWLAFAIGGPDHVLVVFRLISWGSVFLVAPAVYLICHRLGGVHAAGILALVGALCLPMKLFLVHQPYLVDSLAIALMAWSTVALINGWFVVLPNPADPDRPGPRDRAGLRAADVHVAAAPLGRFRRGVAGAAVHRPGPGDRVGDDAGSRTGLSRVFASHARQVVSAFRSL